VIAARSATRARVAAIAVVAGAVAVAVGLALARRGDNDVARCGPGFVASGPRCLVPEAQCPARLVVTPYGCDAPEVRVLVAAGAIAIGPSDWEAEGRVRARSIRVASFRIDAFEATVGRWGRARSAADDPARAASGMPQAEARAYCESRGGRLPTEDEWIVAAVSASNPPRRYPWGDTGAVCRRAAWGLVAGPCAHGADGPDTVGAHPDGDSPLGLHDLAGNVAEWVTASWPGSESSTEIGIAKGGSWNDALAAELRVWARMELDPGRGDPRVGVRCAYPP
jgi:formylglycine-generating enzyme required for sulfatase activity